MSYSSTNSGKICRNDTFKLLLKELLTNKGEILSWKSVIPCKNRKNSRGITSEQEINPVQIPHPFNATFKFPSPWARCTVKCPRYARGKMLKFRIDRRIKRLIISSINWKRLKLQTTMLICGSLHISGHRLLCSSKDLVKNLKQNTRN